MEFPADYFLRPFAPTDSDYEGVIALGRVALGDDMPMDGDTLRRMDKAREPGQPWGRSVTVHNNSGQIRGMAQWGQLRGTDTYFFWIAVHPLYRGQGLGHALYKDLLTGCAPYQPEAVHTYGLEDDPQTLAFLQRRGFTEISRTRRSELKLSGFQPEKFTSALENVTAQGIEIQTLSQIAADPEACLRLYDTVSALWADVPSPIPHMPPDFDHWSSRLLENYLPHGFFIAIDQATGEFVGVSTLSHMPGCADLQTLLTGVRREYRRRGIALALKVRAAQHAQSIGAPTIRTGNATTNTGMLAINERLGFQQQPARIRFTRSLRSV